MYRFEVKSGDRRDSDSSFVDRVETYISGGLNYDRVVDLSFDVLVESGSPIDGWFLITQIHQNNGMSPPFSVELTNGNIEITKRSSDDLYDSGNGVRVVLHSEPLVFSKWYSFAISVKLGVGGYCFASIDGSNVVAYSGGIGYIDGGAYSLKYGIYRQASINSQAVQFGNYIVSN